MPESIDSKEGNRHLFLFWIIVPIVLAWFLVSYIIGAIANKPLWESAFGANTIQPYVREYFHIEKGTTGMVTLWFDDAWLSQYTVAAPILKEFGLAGAVAVPTGLIGGDRYMNWAQLRALQHDGWEIVNHSVRHDCTMQTWSREEIARELDAATKVLWTNKLPSEHFVSPCGVQSKLLLEEVRERFVSFRGAEGGYNDLATGDEFSLKAYSVADDMTVGEIKSAIDQATRDNVWVILVFHPVGEIPRAENRDKETYSISEANFREVVSYIANSNIQVVLPSQALEWLRIPL